MDQLIDEFLKGPQNVSSAFSLWELLASLALSSILCCGVGFLYRATHRGVSYSQSFVVTVVLVGVIVSVIMLIIGSNIARAFTLVGALSIIRFRNAVKETRDVGFIFLSMAIGMACGIRFYGAAIVFTIFMICLVGLLHSLSVFASGAQDRVLRIHLADDKTPEEAFGPVFEEFLSKSSLLSMETARQGVFLELVYSVVLRPGAEAQDFIRRLREANGNAKVALVQSESTNL